MFMVLVYSYLSLDTVLQTPFHHCPFFISPFWMGPCLLGFTICTNSQPFSTKPTHMLASVPIHLSSLLIEKLSSLFSSSCLQDFRSRVLSGILYDQQPSPLLHCIQWITPLHTFSSMNVEKFQHLFFFQIIFKIHLPFPR